MTHTRRQLDHLLDDALDLPAEDLPNFVTDQCPTALRSRLAGLLEIRDETETNSSFSGGRGLFSSGPFSGGSFSGGSFSEGPFSGGLLQELACELGEPTALLTTGDQVDDWRVTGSLGHGGMGDVYRAEDDEGHVVALKVARQRAASIASQCSISRHCDLEREILATLHHPNIVGLIDHGTHEDGRPYLALEVVEGTHIDDHCDIRRLSVEERLRLFLSLSRTVQAVHEAGAIHRDLKPSNVLVTEDGDVTLIDFGIAKWIDGWHTTAVKAPEATVEAMTPDCASPEQFLGRPTTEATDVYQLGVLLFQLLTGERPHHLESRNPAIMKRVVCEEEPRRPSTLFAGPAAWDADAVRHAGQRSATVPQLARALGGELDAIVLKALRIDPSHRYAKVSDLISAIENHLGERATPRKLAA